MKLLVCGGRDFVDTEMLYRVLDEIHEQNGVDVIFQGGARGADIMAYFWACERQIPEIRQYNAQWDDEGKKAGSIRNARMLRKSQPDAVMAFPGGIGTADMMRKALAKGYTVYEIDETGGVTLHE